MTVEEAKKILEKEGFKLKGPGRAGVVSKSFTEYESHEICEAMQIVCSAGYEIMMLAGVFEARKARLRLELTENTKTPGLGEEQPKEKKGIIYPTTFPKADFHYYKHVLNEGNPALKESASQFNDALLDEQAKEIERLKNENAELLGMVERMKEDVKEVDSNFYAVNKENKRLDKKVLELIKDKELMKKATLSQLDDFIEIYNLLTKESQKAKRLGKEIARLNKNIYKKNLKIKELRKESSRHLRGKIKMFGENVDLEQMLKDKNAVLSDVAEELRLSKIREKNLVEVSQKYTKENEELKKELANKVVNKIDAQALKSAESALAYKEKVIAEKDEVIADLGKELKAQKNMMDELSLKYDGAKVNQLELMIKQYEATLSLFEADNSFKDAMLDYLSKSYDESQKRAAAFVYKSLSKSTEHGNGIADQMKPVRRKRKNTKK